jgi:hypothetical protein
MLAAGQRMTDANLWNCQLAAAAPSLAALQAISPPMTGSD